MPRIEYFIVAATLAVAHALYYRIAKKKVTTVCAICISRGKPCRYKI